MFELADRIEAELEKRRREDRLRELSVLDDAADVLNLSNNDYLEFASSQDLIHAAKDALEAYGCSSSASPLLGGFGPMHSQLLETLKALYGLPSGMLWNTGYAANQAILSLLPKKGDCILADRLVHNSMIRGMMQSGARLQRYKHLDMIDLEAKLQKATCEGRIVFVVTESLFSMDGDYPMLEAIAALKKRYAFVWILDEAHAVGWYGEKGAGLAEHYRVLDSVDVLVGTLGKALGSMGAFSLFKEERLATYFTNFSGEFIYSTYLAPACAAAASMALQKMSALSASRASAQAASRQFRASLNALGYAVDPGDSPIVAVRAGDESTALEWARALLGSGIRVGAVRPPTVPEGQSCLRLSLKLNWSEERNHRVLRAFETLGGGTQ